MLRLASDLPSYIAEDDLEIANFSASTQMPELQSHVTTPGRILIITLFIYLVVCFGVFQDRVSLCSPGWPGTRCVDQAALELRSPASASATLLISFVFIISLSTKSSD